MIKQNGDIVKGYIMAKYELNLSIEELEKELAEMTDNILREEQEIKLNDVIGNDLFEDLR